MSVSDDWVRKWADEIGGMPGDIARDLLVARARIAELEDTHRNMRDSEDRLTSRVNELVAEVRHLHKTVEQRSRNASDALNAANAEVARLREDIALHRRRWQTAERARRCAR